MLAFVEVGTIIIRKVYLGRGFTSSTDGTSDQINVTETFNQINLNFIKCHTHTHKDEVGENDGTDGVTFF